MSRVGLALTIVLLLGVMTMTSAFPSSENYKSYGQELSEDFAHTQQSYCYEHYSYCIQTGRPARICQMIMRECERYMGK